MDEQPARPAFRAINGDTEFALLRSLLDREEFGISLLRPLGEDFEYVYANPALERFAPTGEVLGRTVAQVWGGAGGRVLQALHDVIETGEPWLLRESRSRSRDRDGRTNVLFYNTRVWRLDIDGQTHLGVVMWDVTAEVEARQAAAGSSKVLKKSERLMHVQERESVMLQGANRILNAAIDAKSEEELGSVCLEVAEEITESAFGFLAELQDDGLLHDVAISDSGWAASGMHGAPGHPPRLVHEITGLYGEVLKTGQTLYTNDLSGHPCSTGTPDDHPPLRSFLGVPIKFDEQTVGMIAIANRRGGYRAEHAALLEGLAPAVSSAVRSFRATRALARSTELLDAHMSNSPMAIIEFDTEFRVTRWSDESERIFGYAPEEVLGKRIVDFHWVYEEDAELVAAESERMFSGAVTRSKNTNRNYRKDGAVIWCEWYSSAIHDENGVLVSVLSRVLDVTARRKAEEDLWRQTHRTMGLKLIGDVASSGLDISGLGQRLSSALANLTGASITLLTVADDAGTQSVAGSHGMPEDLLAEMTVVPPDSDTYRVFIGKKPVYMTDIDAAGPEFALERARRAGVMSVASVPLLIEGQPIGVLTLAWPKPRPFPPEETSFLESLAGQTAVGLQNAMLYEAERSRRRRIQALHGVLEIAVASLGPADAAQHILGYLMDHHTFDLASCWLARGDVLELLAEINYPPEYRLGFSPMPLSAPYDSPKVVRSGRPIVVRNVAKANPAVRSMYASIGVKIGAYVIVPLRSRGRTVGTLNLGWIEPRAITPSDLGFYKSLGSELGVVLENAQLLEERTTQVKYAEALNRINEAVHSTLEFDEIMRRVVVESSEAAGFDGGAVHLKQGDVWRFAYGHNMPSELQSLKMTSLEAAFSSAVLEKGDAMVVTNAHTEDALAGDLVERFGIASLLALPLSVRGRPVGVLITGSRRSDFVFEDRIVDFMRKVAATVSLALENARLYEAERSIADRLQSALLTLPEKIEGLTFAHAYRSATEAARVGGDFYDLFELGGNRVGVVIGDVAGKGIDAAVLTSLVKNTIQAHASEPGKTPGQVLELTNEIIFKSTPMEAFVTVFFGVLDCRDGTLAYANGGHTSGALLRPEGLASLQVTGPLLGAFGTARFRDTWARLDMGDVLFLYTDGLTEARRGEEMFGESRVFDALAHASGTTPIEILSDVIGEVVAFAHGRLHDDVAVLAVQLTGCKIEGVEQQRLDV